MDPEAVRELQRLYASKNAASEKQSRKRVRAEDHEQNRSRHTRDGSTEDRESQVSDENFIDDESFSAFSDDDDDNDLTQTESDLVEVVTFDGSAANPSGESSTVGYKSFMSGKVPKSGTSVITKSRALKDDDESDSDAAEDLKKDKELQKLLRESHLLHTQGDGSLETEGKTRHKAMSAQLIANGAAKPKQRKMPIGMRKGIEAAASKREGAADKYNRDNGIITARKATPIVKKRSNKTLHELNLGKYKNGKLSISRKEIDRVNGPKGGSGKGKKKRGFRDFSNIG